MRAFFTFLAIVYLFSGCNNSDIKKTKELNKNLLKNSSTEKNIDAKEIAKMNNSNKIALEKLKSKTIENLESIKAKNLEKIEEIKAKKEQKLKELELQKATTEALSKEKQISIEAKKSIKIAEIKSNVEITKAKEKNNFYRVSVIIISIVTLLWLIFYFFNKFSKRRHEAMIKEQELNYQAYIQESRLKHENLGKMLDIINDKESDKEIKKEITKLLTHNKKSLLEHKRI